MKISFPAALLSVALLSAGCASVSVTSNAFLGSPHYGPTDPGSVQILTREPGGPTNLQKLGQVFLDVQGRPPRDQLEQRLRVEAAKLGANAVYVVSDRLHLFPQVYSDFWWGPSETFVETHRDIIAVAVRMGSS